MDHLLRDTFIVLSLSAIAALILVAILWVCIKIQNMQEISVRQLKKLNKLMENNELKKLFGELIKQELIKHQKIRFNIYNQIINYVERQERNQIKNEIKNNL